MTSNKHTADPPTPLFPRKVVIEMYRAAHSEASWGGVERTAQAIQNPIELDWLITKVETDFTHFCPDGQTFEAANQTWVRMSEFAPTLSMFSSAEPDKPAKLATVRELQLTISLMLCT